MSHELSKVSYLIEQKGGACKLTVVHEVESAPLTAGKVQSGWPPILSSLKTLLETGKPLAMSI